MMLWDREWYLEFKSPGTAWRAMYATHAADENNPQQYVELEYTGWDDGVRYLNKIYLRTLPEIIRALNQYVEITEDLVQSGQRHYRLHNIKTGETIPGELFAD